MDVDDDQAAPVPSAQGRTMKARLAFQAGFWQTALIIVAPALALLIMAWTFLFAQIGYEYRGVLSDVHRDNANLALALEQHTVRTIASVDLMLRFLKRDYARYGAVDIEEAGGEGRIDRDVVVMALISDEKGDILMKTGEGAGSNISAQEHFKFHREHSGRDLRVGAPVRGKLTGRTIIPVSRRIELPGGGFAGIVAAGIDPEYFGRFYAQADLGRSGMVLLVGLDGISRARRVGLGNENSSGQDMRGSTLMREQALAPAGSFLSVGRVEGVRRFTSYRTVRQYGLVVAVGQSEAEALAPYYERRRFYLWSGGIFTALVVLITGLIFVGMRRSQQAQEDRLLEAARLRATFDQQGIGIAHTALDGRFLKVNAKLCDMLGYGRDELLGKVFAEVTHPEDRGASVQAAASAVGDGAVLPFEKRYVRKDGGMLWASVTVSLVRDARGAPQYFVAMVQDISARKLAEEKIVHRATHDVLTDLPNRALFTDRLEQAIRHARRQGWTAGVMFMDLDRFKQVNDNFGHAAGDALLKEVARRLARAIRDSDTAARVGGDEFAVVLGELADPRDATVVAQKILDAMALPMTLEGHDYIVTVSLGITLFPHDGEEVEMLLRNADEAMFRAKQAGRNCFRFHDATTGAQAA
jgi:diguanylate cyclase (GGDEF)-like protein/PAS domain S-box-containing protein